MIIAPLMTKCKAAEPRLAMIKIFNSPSYLKLIDYFAFM